MRQSVGDGDVVERDLDVVEALAAVAGGGLDRPLVLVERARWSG